MKKIHLYLLWALVAFALQSCLHDNKELFDKSAAERLDEAASQYKSLLESSGEGWLLQYYAGKDYSNGGYTLLLQFKNGKVTAMGDYADPELVATSDYDVLKDQGPVLSFNTYNAVIHPLAEARLGSPEGIQGDYEFAIVQATQDTLYLCGKRWKNNMLLTRLPKDTNREEYMLGLLSVREAVSANTFNFILGNDTVAQGKIDATTHRLSVTIGETVYDMPFCFTSTGIALQQPITLAGKPYQTLTWDEENKRFAEGDFSAAMYLPGSYKPLDFWLGEWTIKTRHRRKITLTISQDARPNVLKGVLKFNNIDYEIILPYDPATGRIELTLQPVKDPTYQYPSGIILVPASYREKKYFESAEGGLFFVWNEDLQRADAVDSGLNEGVIDSYYGIAYGDDLQPLRQPNGDFVRPIALESIEYIRKSN